MTCLVVELTDLTHLTISYTEWSIVRGYRVIISQRIQGDPYPRETDLWTHIFLWTQMSVRYNIFQTPKVLGPTFFSDTQKFETQQFSDHIFLHRQRFFGPKIVLGAKRFFPPPPPPP